MEERSPYDPRPATARPVGTVDRVVADDGSVEVWRVTEVRDKAAALRELKDAKKKYLDFDERSEVEEAKINILAEHGLLKEEVDRLEKEIEEWP